MAFIEQLPPARLPVSLKTAMERRNYIRPGRAVPTWTPTRGVPWPPGWQGAPMVTPSQNYRYRPDFYKIYLRQPTFLAGLGQVKPPAEKVDLLTAIRSVYGGFLNVEPLLDFIGKHPVLTFSLAMGMILLGGAVGGYIGAGARTAKR